MELRVLEYFLALVKEGTISEAAKALGISQPTLSRQLIGLEKELGLTLFERNRNGITLTKEGVYLHRRASEIVSLVQTTQHDLVVAQDIIAGGIAIGCAETRTMVDLAKIMHAMQKDYPDVTFKVISQTAEVVVEQIKQGLLDFGLVLRQVPAEGLDYLQINSQERPGVVVPEKSRFAQKQILSMAELENEPLIVPTTYAHSGILGGYTSIQEGGTLNIVATYNLAFNSFRMAEAGMGLVVTLEGVSDTNPARGFVFRPLNHAMNLPAYLVWQPQDFRTRACEVFWQRACEKFSLQQ